jgi:hypothetical protein
MFKNKYLKYKQKYLDLKQQIGGSNFIESQTLEQNSSAAGGGANETVVTANISLPLHQKCEDCYLKKSCPHTHQQFTFECTPYTDVTVGKYNIVNWDNNYIYYNQDNEANTIKMSKSFEFINVEPIEEFNKPILPNYINDYINHEIYGIPLYFMYTNTNNNIFDLFCYSCSVKELDSLQISYETDVNKFVKFRGKFNIFSLSFLCNNFFDVIRLFLDEVNITTKLTELFKDFAIEKLYYQSIYKENFNAIKKKSEYLTYTFFSEERKDLILPNKYEIVDRNEVIEKLKKQIELYKKKFSILNRIIPEFDKIYIMSILHYRLIKSPNISSSWNFDTHYIYRIITSSREYGPKYIFNIYLDDNLVLYDNSEEISFRDEKYRCCMENTLLQFLKVLFWDTNMNAYNFTNIEKMIKTDFKDKIDEFFMRIDDELTKKFISEWVIFVTELSNDYHFNKEENKAELFPDIHNFIIFLKNIIKSEYYDIDSKVFLSNIIKNINTNYTIDYTTNELQTDINIITYKIFKIILTNHHAYFEFANINANNINILTKIVNDDRLLSNYLYKNLELCLFDINSFIIFLSLSLEKSKEKSLEKPKKKSKKKSEEKTEEEKSEEEQLIIEKYLKNIDINNKKKSYAYFFNDNIIPRIHTDILLSLLDNPEVYSTWNIRNLYGITLWHNIGNYVKIESFWDKVIDKNLINESWDIPNNDGDTVWHNVVLNIKLKSFWNRHDENGDRLDDYDDRLDDYDDRLDDYDDRLDDYGDRVDKNGDRVDKNGDRVDKNGNRLDKNDDRLDDTILNIKPESFWDKVIDKNLINESWDISNDYGYTVWHHAVKNITSESFWDNVSDKNLINESWDIQNDYGNTVWHDAIKNIKSETFWDKVIDNNLINESWARKNSYDDIVWYHAIINIKSETFWDKVIDKDLINESWDTQNDHGNTVWHYAIKNIKSESFWERVIDLGLCRSWDIKNNGDNSVWHDAVKNIKSETFWNKVIDNNLINESWARPNNNNDTLWHYAIINIESETFWNKVIDKNLITPLWDIVSRHYRLNYFYNYGETIWYYAILNIKSETFWNKVIDKDLITASWNITNESNITLWHDAIENIKSESFWNKVIDKDLISESWNIRARHNYATVWSYAVLNIKSTSFWKKVIDRDLITESWNIFDRDGDTIWHHAILNIKSTSFWNNVIEKDLITKSWYRPDKDGQTVWDYAYQNIRSKRFWDKVFEKNLHTPWDKPDKYDEAEQNITSRSFWDKSYKK